MSQEWTGKGVVGSSHGLIWGTEENLRITDPHTGILTHDLQNVKHWCYLWRSVVVCLPFVYEKWSSNLILYSCQVSICCAERVTCMQLNIVSSLAVGWIVCETCDIRNQGKYFIALTFIVQQEGILSSVVLWGWQSELNSVAHLSSAWWDRGKLWKSLIS